MQLTAQPSAWHDRRMQAPAPTTRGSSPAPLGTTDECKPPPRQHGDHLQHHMARQTNASPRPDNTGDHLQHHYLIRSTTSSVVVVIFYCVMRRNRACCSRPWTKTYLVVLVHHPIHDLTVRAHIRRRNVLIFANVRIQSAAERARDLFQVSGGKLLDIDRQTPLGAPEGQILERALDRHPLCQRSGVLDRHFWVIAQTALARSQQVVVLHAVTGEDTNL